MFWTKKLMRYFGTYAARASAVAMQVRESPRRHQDEDIGHCANTTKEGCFTIKDALVHENIGARAKSPFAVVTILVVVMEWPCFPVQYFTYTTQVAGEAGLRQPGMRRGHLRKLVRPSVSKHISEN